MLTFNKYSLYKYLLIILTLFYFSCCGAGTAADTMQVTRMVSANFSLQAFKFPEEMVPVAFAARSLRQYLFKYMVI